MVLFGDVCLHPHLILTFITNGLLDKRISQLNLSVTFQSLLLNEAWILNDLTPKRLPGMNLE